ncbi:MAG: hypothetical protein IT492_06295 [Gammaproteobacteria bacterium]|nr:hypothetical protein [Gammaproteobacteria bacterium]
MNKDAFNLRCAALATALALVFGTTSSFADEAVAEAPVVQPAAEVDALATDVSVVGVAGDGVGEVTVAEEPAAVDEPAPVDEPRTIDTPPAADEPLAVDEPVAEPVAVEDPAPVDECGMMCWNVADMPPGAVQKGGEEVDPRIMEFGAPEPTMNVSAELSGAIGVSEQLGATEAELNDDDAVQPLTASAEPAVVTTANAGAVNVIRDGHLR